MRSVGGKFSAQPTLSRMASLDIRSLAVGFVGTIPVVRSTISTVLRLGMGDCGIVWRPTPWGRISMLLGRVVWVRIDCLILKCFDEDVEPTGDESAEDRTDPVYPMITRKLSSNDAGSEGTGWVQTSAGIVNSPIKRRGQLRFRGKAYRGETYINSAMKSERPIPIGAIKVPRCLSAASMKMVKTS